MLRSASNNSNVIITRFHNGGHDSEAIPSQWIFPKKIQKPRVLGLPVSALLILLMECLEQLSYGAVSIMLYQYMVNLLNIESATANSIMNGRNFFGLACALVFAVLADCYLGKWRAIFISVFVYICGLIVITLTSSPLGFGDFPYDPHAATWGLFLAIVLMGIGTGGIKPNVAPMCAEQVFKINANAIERLSLYYVWTINFGCLIGLGMAPYLIDFGPRVKDNEGTAFYVVNSIACGLFVFGLAAFLAGTNYYTHRIPRTSIFIDFYKIIKSAIKNRHMSFAEVAVIRQDSSVASEKDSSTSSRVYPTSAGDRTSMMSTPSSMVGTPKSGISMKKDTITSVKAPVLEYDAENNNYNLTEEEKATIQNESVPAVESKGTFEPENTVKEFDFDHEKHWLYKSTAMSHSDIKALRQIFRIVPFVFFFGAYFLLYNQIGSAFIQQSAWMNKPSWVQDASMIIVDPLMVIILIPVHSAIIFPFMRNKWGIELRHITRMLVGFFFMAMTYLIAAILQYQITQQGDLTADGDFIGKGDYVGAKHSDVSVFWLALVYFICAIGEVWAKTAFLEWLYSQAPKTMVSCVMSLYALSDALGSLLAIIGHNMFIPENFLYTFIGFTAGMLFVVMPLFYLMYRNYENKGVYGGEVVRNEDAFGIGLYLSQISGHSQSNNSINNDHTTTK
eukprot:Nk52_evm1s70 gene=Nk52_evmTU1s70